MELAITDDQTQTTREAISVMQINALYGLIFVLLVTWTFVGLGIGLITVIGIPFILSGLFWVLNGLGESINSIVLLGVVLSLGMLVDDAVVVAESIYYRLQRGADALTASLDSLREVAIPVTLAVLTTVSVFGPLMFIPGLLGDFMRIIPVVVVTALLISLVEAFWMLPAHVIAFSISNPKVQSRSQVIRTKLLHRLRIFYSRVVLKVLRWPGVVLGFFALMVVLTISGMFKLVDNFDFFAGDPQPLYYVSISLPQGVSLEDTETVIRDIEERVRLFMQPGEVHSITGFAGLMYTQDAQYSGENYGQIQVSLTPSRERNRSTREIFDAVRLEVEKIQTIGTVTLLAMESGPPTGRDLSIKVRGDSFEDIRIGADRLLDILHRTDGFTDIEDDTSTGQPEYTLRPDADAARRVGISPRRIARTSALMVDGEIVARMQDGEEVEVRVMARPRKLNHIEELLDVELMTPGRQVVPMREVVETTRGRGPAAIRHFRFRRSITISANIDPDKWDVVRAYNHTLGEWAKISSEYPGLDLDTTGQLDDINEGIQSIIYFGAFGIFLMYVVLASFFRSYYQPFMIFMTVIMALMGVTMGFLVSGNSISLYSLYGVAALMGITVNSSIVLIWAANDRLKSGMSVIHSIVYAARRRVVPILITSLTTIAGLSSLAIGLGGESLLWGPVASTIVWGMGFSTILTLLIIPLVYRLTMARSKLISAASGG
jgi:multidrug efflux pump subunit AcrB